MKRIVICFDGTWNNPERDKDAGERVRYKPTNVLKTYRAVPPTASDGTSQITFYLEGVGAFVGERTRFGRLQSWADRLFGGLFGGGFEGRVKSAYRFLVANYEPGDEIYVFGFSRGAAQAQSLVRFVEWTGGILHKDDEYYLPELFDRFRESRADRAAAARAFADIRARRERERAAGDRRRAAAEERSDLEAIRDPQPVEIAFLGVFDTVLALGSRVAADRGEESVATVQGKLAFHVGPEPPAIVRTARQALAIDEERLDYRPQVWLRASPGRSLEQRWFPGVHSNIGGSIHPDGLANFAFRWMLSEAREADLATNPDYIRHFNPSLKGERPRSRGFGDKALELLRGKLGKGRRTLRAVGGDTVTIDRSALDLMLQDPTYRPVNLMADLRAHPSTLDTLSAAKRARLQAILEGREPAAEELPSPDDGE